MKALAAKPTPAILFVDDEELARKYFRRAVEQEFEVLTAADVAEADQLLDANADRIGVLVTDQRMPNGSGTSLLKRVHEDRPELVRILTTAYSDLDSAIEAVNEGRIYRYVTKPWDIRELQTVVRQAAELFYLQREYDALVAEKLSVIQRMLLMDRAKVLCVLATSLQSDLNHAAYAARDVIQFNAKHGFAEGDAVAAGWEDLWTGTVGEAAASVEIATAVRAALQPSGFESRSLDAVVSELAAEQTGVSLDTSAMPKPTPVDAEVFRVLITRLLRLAEHLWPSGGDPKLSCYLSGESSPEAVIRLSGAGDLVRLSQLTSLTQGGLWSSTGPGFDLLLVYFAAHHHAGHVTVEAGSDALSVEVRLPIDPMSDERAPLPEAWVEQVLATLEL